MHTQTGNPLLRAVRRSMLLTLVAVVALAMMQGATVQAQGAKNNVTTLIYNQDGKAAVSVYQAANPTGRELFKVNERMNVILSNDAAYLVMYGTIDEQGTFVATYGKAGDPKSTTLPIEKGFTFIGGSFSPTNKSFSYTQAKLPEKAEDSSAYIFSVLDIGTGKVANFPGTFILSTNPSGKANPLPAIGFYGGPLTIGWLDEARQVVSPFFPFSDGSLDGLFVIDTSKENPPALPVATPLTKNRIPGISLKVFAPDNSRIAYLLNDPNRPVPNYSGPFDPFNTVGVLDIASGNTITIAAPKDNAVGSGLTFTPDGKSLLYVAGFMKEDPVVQGSLIQSGKLFTLDIASGKVTEGPVLTPDTKSVVNQMQVCGPTLFVTVSKLAADSATSILASAPLNNPTQQTVLYSGLGYVQLIGCAQ